MFLVFAFGGPRGGNGGGIATLANAGQMAMIALFLCQLLGGRVSLANFLPNGAFLPNAIRGMFMRAQDGQRGDAFGHDLLNRIIHPGADITLFWTAISSLVPMALSMAITCLCLKFNQRPNRGAPTPAAAAAAVREDAVYMAKIVQRLPIQSFETPADLQLLSATALLERLRKYGVTCQGCVEKQELVEKVSQAGGSSGCTCSVCFEDYVSGDLMRILPCQHRFHTECCDKWLHSKLAQNRAAGLQDKRLSCPLCNAAVQ